MALRTVFVSRQILPASCKDVLPAIQKSSVIYGYKCRCDSRYVGRTAQRFQDRIKQHVPKWLPQRTASQRVLPNRACKGKQPAPECDSAIGQHLLENDQCAANCNDDQFSTVFWTLRAVFSILVCSKPATLKYGDLIYANRKSLSILLNCSSRV